MHYYGLFGIILAGPNSSGYIRREFMTEEQKVLKKAKVVKIDNLLALIERYFKGDEIFQGVLKGKDLEKKGLLLWALNQYRNRNCGVAYVYDSVVRPFKIFYRFDSKRRVKYTTSLDFSWAEKYYRDNNSRELF